jgi:HSP20 family molecular chaperone IbpA
LPICPESYEQTVDVELEKKHPHHFRTCGKRQVKDYRLVFSEYEVGDYERTFTLSGEIDRDKIKANVKLVC